MPTTHRMITFCLSQLISSILEEDTQSISWPNALEQTIQWCQNANPLVRSNAFLILTDLLDSDHDSTRRLFDNLLALLRSSLLDPESDEVRINSSTVIGSLTRNFNKDKSLVSKLKQLAPIVLDSANKMLTSLFQINRYCKSFFRTIIQQFVQGLSAIVSNPSITLETQITNEMIEQFVYPPDLRRTAFEFLINITECNWKTLSAFEGFDTHITRTALFFSMEFHATDEELWLQNDCTGYILGNFNIPWRQRYGTYFALTAFFDAASSSLNATHIQSVFGLVFPTITLYPNGYNTFLSLTSHELTRQTVESPYAAHRNMYAALRFLQHCISDLNWSLMSPYCYDLLAAFLAGLDTTDSCPIVMSIAVMGISTFCQEAQRTDVIGVLPMILDAIKSIISSRTTQVDGKRLSDLAMEALITVSQKVESAFTPHAPSLIPSLLSIVNADNITDEEDRQFQSKALSALTTSIISCDENARSPFIGPITEAIQKLSHNVEEAKKVREHEDRLFFEQSGVMPKVYIDPRKDSVDVAWMEMTRVLKEALLPFMDQIIPPLLKDAMAVPTSISQAKAIAINYSDTTPEGTELVYVDLDGEEPFAFSSTSFQTREDALNMLEIYLLSLKRRLVNYFPSIWIVCLNGLREVCGLNGTAKTPLFGEEATFNQGNLPLRPKGERYIVPSVPLSKVLSTLFEAVCDHIKFTFTGREQELVTRPVGDLAREAQTISPFDILNTSMLFLEQLLPTSTIATEERTSYFIAIGDMLESSKMFIGERRKFPPSVRTKTPWPDDPSSRRQDLLFDPSPFARLTLNMLQFVVARRHHILKEAAETALNTKDDDEDLEIDMDDESEIESENKTVYSILQMSEACFLVLGEHYFPCYRDLLVPFGNALLGVQPFQVSDGESESWIVPDQADRATGIFMTIDSFQYCAEQGFLESYRQMPGFIHITDTFLQKWMAQEQHIDQVLQSSNELEDSFADQRIDIITSIKNKETVATLQKLGRILNSPEGQREQFQLSELTSVEDMAFLMNMLFGISIHVENDFNWLSFQRVHMNVSAATLCNAILPTLAQVLSASDPSLAPLASSSDQTILTQFPTNQVSVSHSLLSTFIGQLHQIFDKTHLIVAHLKKNKIYYDSLEGMYANFGTCILKTIQWVELVLGQISTAIEGGSDQYNSLVSQSPAQLIPFDSLSTFHRTLSELLVHFKSVWITLIPISGDDKEAIFQHSAFIKYLHSYDPTIAGMGLGEEVGKLVLNVFQTQTVDLATLGDKAQLLEQALIKILSVIMTTVKTDYTDDETTNSMVQIASILMNLLPAEQVRSLYDEFDNDRKSELMTLFQNQSQ
ncbi:hypothetical protein BLNAU_18749 [Blattamonas nauphoetae]|uniref:IPO4/5-like TPR repeats domain-containing protein n=1 Tax=Blattamonas nauphoetae TaxID=2049346 RepID=A0ABQ9X4Q9_9EUKA|nr:hypothetical protein BLNAU_18749 [Blattamonas nauphoetae]